MGLEIKEMTIRVKAGVDDSTSNSETDVDTPEIDSEEKLRMIIELISQSKGKKNR